MPVLSVVVPVYGNSAQLRELHARLQKTCEAIGDTEYIYVDDGSPDDSFAILRELAADSPSVRVLSLSRNFGSNAAILAGLSHAGGAAVTIIAADLQDPPELIEQLFAKWREGYEVVLAARRKRDDPALSSLFAGSFNRLFRSLVFKDFPAGGFDFVLMDRQVATGLVAMPEKHSYLYGQILWLGFRRTTVHYDRQRRSGGKSGWTLARKLKYAIDAFTAFSYLPVRAASVLGIMLAVVGLLYAGLIIVLRLRGQIPERGFSALMVALLVVSGVQLIVTGIIGEYLWRVLEEVRPRPPFVVARSLNVPALQGSPSEPSRTGGGHEGLQFRGQTVVAEHR